FGCILRPVQRSTLSPYPTLFRSARASEPYIRQIFIGRAPGLADELAFERKLYVIRKRATTELRDEGFLGAETWYMPSLSYRTLRSEEHTSELQSRENLVCRLLLE